MEPDNDVQDTAETCADSEFSPECRTDEKGKDKDDKDKERIRDSEKEKSKEDTERKDGEKDKIKGLDGTSLDSLLQRLPGCVSRDLIDQLTVITMCFLVCNVLFCVKLELINMLCNDLSSGRILLLKFKGK